MDAKATQTGPSHKAVNNRQKKMQEGGGVVYLHRVFFLQKLITMRSQPSQLIMAETSDPSHLLMWKISQRSRDRCLLFL